MSATPYVDLELFIDGSWFGPHGRRTEEVVNPATGETIATLPHATADDLDRAIAAAVRSFKTWRAVSPFDRSKVIRKAANLLRDRAERLAVLMTLEQGKTLPESRIEIMASADILDWYAEEGRRAYGRVIPSRTDGMRWLVLKEPVGPVAAFSPWNFPAVIPARKIGAALAAGCSLVMKPAEETPATVLEIARALDDAGLPKGVLNVVHGVPADVSTHLIGDDGIRKVTFTGSTVVGQHIAKLAAENGVKRTTLELGGHAPVLIFEDAELDAAIQQMAAFKYRNAGQVCVAPTRFYVHERLHDRFVQGFASAAERLKVGNGLDPDSAMGPMANPRRISAMERLVADAVKAGAELVTGGERIGNRGFFFKPTVLANVPSDAQIMNEEPFGPVAVTVPFATFDEAVEHANRLPYGLAAYAFTTSSRTATALGDAIEAGMVGINNAAINMPETPFGGVKQSGYGSEGGVEGLEAYLGTKFVSQS